MELDSYLIFIAFGLWAILPLHFYLQKKLGERADSSLLWFAAALCTWFLLVWVEKTVPKEEALGLRRMLSVANSACFILFLSYFKEGWKWLNQHIKSVTATPERLAILLTSLVLVVAVFSYKQGTPWLLTETAMSILVSVLISIGFILSFWRRNGMRGMLPMAIIGGLLLIWTQLLNLEHERVIKLPELPFSILKDLVLLRILAFFCLIVNTFALSISAIATEIEEKTTTIPMEKASTFSLENQSKEANQTYNRHPTLPLIAAIKISGVTRHIEAFFYFNTQEKEKLEVKFSRRELSKSKFAFLLKHLTAPSVRSSEFNNYSKEKREILDKLNAKIQELGFEIELKDLLADGNETGVYRLTLPLEMVEIDDSARQILDI